MRREPVEVGARSKIGYVLKRFPRLSETFILNELLELQRQDVEVEVFSLLKPQQEMRHQLLSSLAVPITYLPSSNALKAWTIASGSPASGIDDGPLECLFDDGHAALPELCPGKRPQEAALLCLQAATLAVLASARGISHLHAHFASNATTVALLASRLSGIPYSFTAHARDLYHTYVDEETDSAVRRQKIAEACFVVTVSDYNRRHLTALAGDGAPGKVRRLYNGIDLSRFAFHRNAATDLGEAPMLLAVGRLVGKKGFGHLVEACRILRNRAVAFRCVIVGDGPERATLLRQIRSAGLERQVDLPGAQPQEALLEVMQRAAAMVLPCVIGESGDRDGLPTVLLEALASGLPAISTTVAGIPEIIEHGRSGLLVPPGDPERLADTMQQLLADPALRRRLALEGRSKAERDFDLRRNVAVLRNYFLYPTAGEGPHQEVCDEDRLRHRG